MNLAHHELYFYSPTGIPLTIVKDGGFVSLTYGLKENEPGVLVLELPPNFDTRKLMIDGQIEIWRSYGRGGKRLEGDTGWFMRRPRRVTNQEGAKVIQVTAYSAFELLRRRAIPFVAGSSYAEKVDIPWDDMLREIVYENYGPGASYAGASYGDDPARNLEPWLVVEPYQRWGASFETTHGFSWTYVVNALLEIVNEVRSNGFYCTVDVVRLSPAHYEFRVFVGARGMDRTSRTGQPTVVSEKRRNLQEPIVDENWEDERNYVYTMGQGQETDRVVRTSQDDARIGISPFNRRELLNDQRSLYIPESVQAASDAALESNRPRRSFSGKIVQTASFLYGKHWNWGDIVVAEDEGINWNCHIDTVTVSVDQTGAEIVTGLLRSESDV